MPFFTPIIKQFTPKTLPPSPELLWRLPEDSVAALCLPEDRNNAMFIPEYQLAAQDRNLNSQYPDQLRCNKGDREVFSSQRLEREQRFGSTSSSVHVHTEDMIPHHLLVQLGLAGTSTQWQRYEANPTNYYSYNHQSNVRVSSSYSGTHEDAPTLQLSEAPNRAYSQIEEINVDSTSPSQSSLTQLFNDSSSSGHHIDIRQNIEIPTVGTEITNFHRNEATLDSRESLNKNLESQSSLSQLFLSEDFSTAKYEDILKFYHIEKTELAEPVSALKVHQNEQTFIIRGQEPPMFDLSVKQPADLPWKADVQRDVIEPTDEVSKRDDSPTEHTPILVSPYFPNENHHPVQLDVRTTTKTTHLTDNQAKLRIFGHTDKTTEYQICKEFFEPKPPSIKSNLSAEPKKRKISKTSDAKITSYFPVVKDRTVAEPTNERALSKYKFSQLPTGSKRMSDFYNPLQWSVSSSRPIKQEKNVAVTQSSQLTSPAKEVSQGDPASSTEVLEGKDVEAMASKMENSGNPIDIGFTICYKEQYCLLNRPNDNLSKHCQPAGVMSRVEFPDRKVIRIYQTVEELRLEKNRSFLRSLLSSNCRLVCYEAQAFIIFILDVLEVTDKRVCYDWNLHDPMVGWWLLYPDHQTRSFVEIMEALPDGRREGNSTDWKSLVGRYLDDQSRVVDLLTRKLSRLSLWTVNDRMETPLTPILAAMELRSIRVDYDRLQEISKVLQEKIGSIEREAWKLVGKTFQLTSPCQLRKILYDELRLDEIGGVIVKSTPSSGAKSTDEGTVKTFQNLCEQLKSLLGLHPLPKLVLEHRHAHKIKSTYIDGMLAHTNDRSSIYTRWEQCAAATGRITSSSPNLQAIPKREMDLVINGKPFNARESFVARPGSTFVAVDFQQIELRVFAHVSKDRRLIEALNHTGDIFETMTQTRLGAEQFEKVERDKTKTLMYALLYGAGSYKIAELLSVTADDANKISREFYALFPGLKLFRARVLNECRTSGELRSLSGRRRLFPDINSDSLPQRRYAERQALNFVVQGSAADLCKAAMIRTESALRRLALRSTLLLQIHDELLWELDDDDVPAAVEAIKSSMEATSDYWLDTFKLDVKFPVTVTTGRCWGYMN